MDHTENYQLSQWERSDKVLMEDFNADNIKIDSALGELSQSAAEHSAAIAKLGNCQIYRTTYTGSGTGSLSHRITFPRRPTLVCVMGMSANTCIMTALYGAASGTVFSSSGGRDIPLSWSGNSVSWDYMGLNNGQTYAVVALMDAES